MSASQTVHGAPVLQGWITSQQDGILTAVRVETLTAYQLAYGCRTTVTAQTGEELDLLCVAERVHSAMVAKAEALAPTPCLPPYDQVPVSKTLLGIDELGTPDGG